MADLVPANINPGTPNRGSVVHASQGGSPTNSRGHVEEDISRLQSAVNDFNMALTYGIGDFVRESGIININTTAVTIPAAFNQLEWDALPGLADSNVWTSNNNFTLGINFDDVNTGIIQSGLDLLSDVATGGFHILRVNDTPIATLGAASNIFTAPQTDFRNKLEVTGDDSLPGENQSTLRMTMYNENPLGPIFDMQKARGIEGGPLAIKENDSIFDYAGFGHDGDDFSFATQWVVQAAEDWSLFNHGAKLSWHLTPIGSAGNPAILTVDGNGVFDFQGNNFVNLGTLNDNTIPTTGDTFALLGVQNDFTNVLNKFNTEVRVVNSTGFSEFRSIAYGNLVNGPNFVGQKARGSESSPDPIETGDRLVTLDGDGYNGTIFVSGGSLQVRAAENWGASNRGTDMELYTTPLGDNVETLFLTLGADGAADFKTNDIVNAGALNTHTIPGGTSTLALLSNNLGDFAATTSAQLASVISDSTGSDSLVFATSPTLNTPVISNFINSQHNHSSLSQGGQLTNSALIAGLYPAITGLGIQTQDLDMGGFAIQNSVLVSPQIEDTIIFNNDSTQTESAIPISLILKEPFVSISTVAIF